MVDEPIATVAESKVHAPAPAHALNATPLTPFASVGVPPGTDTACPLRIACPAVGALNENALGGVWSIVNVVDASAPTPFRLSVGRACTVYEPSAGKLADGNEYDQLVVPVASTNTGDALENALPFQ